MSKKNRSRRPSACRSLPGPEFVEGAPVSPLGPAAAPATGEETAHRLQVLRGLAADLILGDEDDDAGVGVEEHPKVPAGYTYLGQLMVHDLVHRFDPRVVGRTPLLPYPRLDLDSVYGGGPRQSPFLYQRGDFARFRLGGERGEDLPRDAQGAALIPEPRNDSNAIVSQLHLALLRAHNRILDELPEAARSRRCLDDCAAARRILTAHFQWIVLGDYLPRLLDRKRRRWLKRARRDHLEGRRQGLPVRCFQPSIHPAIGMSALRFGHAMVRPRYDLNAVARGGIPLAPTLRSEPRDASLVGFGPLVQDWWIDWGFFFKVSPERGETAASKPQRARRIVPRLTRHLARLPFEFAGPAGEELLPLLDFQRDDERRVPSGQRMARLLGEEPLESGETPLSLYLMREAEELEEGLHLGPVGSTIVAEFLFGVLAADEHSILNGDPRWKPHLGPDDGPYRAVALLLHAWPAPREESSPPPPDRRRGRRRRPDDRDRGGPPGHSRMKGSPTESIP